MIQTKLEIMNAMCCPKGQPALSRKDLGKYNFHCNKIDPEWKEKLENEWWATNFNGKLLESEEKRAEKMYHLRDRLLSIAGEEVCMPLYEEDYEDIMQYGQIFLGGSRVRMVKGEPSRCHSNCCNLYELNHAKFGDSLRIATGYALSNDGMWRQHSWLVMRGDRIYKVIETTVRRELYFGFCMDTDQAQSFCFDNY